MDGEAGAGSARVDTRRKIILRQLRAFRERKQQHFPSGLCRDRNFEILLGLYEAQLDSTLMTARTLAELTDLEHGAALRRLHVLEQQGLIERSADLEDRRRITVLLSADGRTSVERFIDALAEQARTAPSVPAAGL